MRLEATYLHKIGYNKKKMLYSNKTFIKIQWFLLANFSFIMLFN